MPAIWGKATAPLRLSPQFSWVDSIVLLTLAAVIFGIGRTAQQWTGALRPAVEIDLSIRALPKYTLLSLSRGLVAYVLSLLFSLAYGYWAAKDRIAERVLIPILDVLQSIPVLGFLPGVVLALVAAFPRSNIGLELAAILLIFTGQAWNMTFSFYHSVRSIPNDQQEVATIYRFTAWERFRWVELPFSTIGLVWNSMMSMAGGWFFLMISEAFVLGDNDFRLPGLGSYMSVAVARGDTGAMLDAIVAMTAMIVLLDQLLWRPVVVWAEKFRVEEGGAAHAQSSWFLSWLRRSQLIGSLVERLKQPSSRDHSRQQRAIRSGPARSRKLGKTVSILLLLALLLGSLLGGYRLFELLRLVSIAQWKQTVFSGLFTLGRVLLASFPAPMLFPAVTAILAAAGVSLGWGSVVLMLLGTQWYVLFNVIAGAMAVPADLREAAISYHFRRSERLWKLYLPAIFPYLITGWITAAGGAWNASIVSEYVTFNRQVLSTWGLGAQISQAAAAGNFPLLSASVVVMSAMVVAFNRLVWKRFNMLAETRFSLSK